MAIEDQQELCFSVRSNGVDACERCVLKLPDRNMVTESKVEGGVVTQIELR